MEQMHIAMYPWLALGHISAYTHLANKIAKKGHRISFFIPKRTKAKVEHLNRYPHLITFIDITIPPVEGLTPDAETTSDIPPQLTLRLVAALDRTEKDIQKLLLHLKPNIIFFDFACFVPNLARSLGIKSVQYHIVNMLFASYVILVEKQCRENNEVGAELNLNLNLMRAPPGFPDSSIKLSTHEVQQLAISIKCEFRSGFRLHDLLSSISKLSDAVGYRSCREIEAPYAEFLQSFYGKPVLLPGPVLPEPPTTALEPKWAEWLSGFNPGSVIYCAFGSECRLPQDQFKEFLLGLELTGFPFLAALKAPIGCESVEEAIPEGFLERVKGRGIVHGGWVQQILILDHPSVGCFITHCGAASMIEALVNKGQIVVLPNAIDQFLNSKVVCNSLKAGVEVEKGDEDGKFTKESVCKAVKTVMDDESEVAREVRANHLKLRNRLLAEVCGRGCNVSSRIKAVQLRFLCLLHSPVCCDAPPTSLKFPKWLKFLNLRLLLLHCNSCFAWSV
ncbi:UDP-glycosyltransferase 79B30, partial [Mucuna pruriens]